MALKSDAACAALTARLEEVLALHAVRDQLAQQLSPDEQVAFTTTLSSDASASWILRARSRCSATRAHCSTMRTATASGRHDFFPPFFLTQQTALQRFDAKLQPAETRVAGKLHALFGGAVS